MREIAFIRLLRLLMHDNTYPDLWVFTLPLRKIEFPLFSLTHESMNKGQPLKLANLSSNYLSKETLSSSTKLRSKMLHTYPTVTRYSEKERDHVLAE